MTESFSSSFFVFFFFQFAIRIWVNSTFDAGQDKASH